MARRSDAPLSVRVPAAEANRPSWGRVGIIAIFGFAIGVAWPRLAGVQLGPSAPADALQAAASAAANVEVPSASVAAVASAPIVPSASAAPPAPALSVKVSGAQLLSCKNDDGETLKGKACGSTPAFDPIARVHLEKLGQLASLEKERGKITVVVTLDFKKNKVFATTGKSSTVKNLEAVKSFLETELANVSLGPLAHDHPRYTLQYAVTLGDAKPGDAAVPAPGTPAPRGDATKPAASGEGASIVWDVAIVRDAPQTGAIVARLPRNTAVKILGAPQGGWYHVQFGTNEGWLYRGALGK